MNLKIMTLMLLGCLSLAVFADRLDGPDQEPDFTYPDPGNIPTPPPSCKNITEIRDANTVCCPGLQADATTNVCNDVKLTDPDLKNCVADSDCSDGKGCIQMTLDDLFTKFPTNSNDPANVAYKESKNQFAAQIQSRNNIFLDAGATCTRHIDCKSYFCDSITSTATPPVTSRKCAVPAKICRLAALGEMAPGNLKCQDGLIKDPNAKCITDPAGQTNFIVGNTVPLRIRKKAGEQCKFNFPNDLEIRSSQAIKALRSIEFLLSKNSRTELSNDPVGFGRYFDKAPMVDKELIISRRDILRQFTYGDDDSDPLSWKNLQADIQKVKNAKSGSQDQIALYGSLVTSDQIASRQATGFDALMFMKGKNILQKRFETNMKELSEKYLLKIGTLSKSVATWTDPNVRNWKIGTDNYEFRIWWWRFKLFETGFGMTFPKPPASPGFNTDIITKNDKLMDNLTMITGEKKADIITRMTNRTAYLFNPLFSLMGGSNPPSPTQMRDNLKKQIILHLKRIASESSSVKVECKKYYYADWCGIGGNFDRLCTCSGDGCFCDNGGAPQCFDSGPTYCTTKLDNTRRTMPDFLYEAEILDLKVQGQATCLDPRPTPGGAAFPLDAIANNAECSKLKETVEDLTDTVLAQWLAWSYHDKSQYLQYFENAASWKRRLLLFWEAKLLDAVDYYTEIANYRNDQNACIDLALNELIKVNTEGSDKKGITLGSIDYYKNTQYKTATVLTKSSQSLTKTTTNKVGNFNLNSNLNNNNFNANLNSSVLSNNNSATDSGQFGTLAPSGFAAIRQQELKEINDQAIAKGINVAEKNQNSSEALNRIGVGSGNGLLSSASGQIGSQGGANNAIGGAHSAGLSGMVGGSGNGSGGSSSRASLDGEEDALKNDLNQNKFSTAAGAASGAAAGVAAGAAGGQGLFGGLAGGGSYVSSGASSGSGSGSDDGSSGKNDGKVHEDNLVMLQNYERTKGQYNKSDDDSLFQVISKTYIRSLDKILTRKKAD